MRSFLQYLLVQTLVLFSCVAFAADPANIKLSSSFLSMSDKIDLVIRVQDEAGTPIPYVTVLRYFNPDSTHISNQWSRLEMQDLWRITTRYKATSEFMLNFGERPMQGVWVTEMGNEAGVIKHIFNYESFVGLHNGYKRPNPTNFGYTLVKHGYLPEKLELNVPTNKNKVEATITLKRDSKEAIETAPYLIAYERLRYELSDTSKNEVMTTDNQRRIAKIESELDQAAQQAIAAGDNKAAARIYIRMRYLPTITLENGITGYSQVDRESERSKRAWELAKQLDPDNLFIWIHTIYQRGDNRSDLPLKDWQKSMAKQMDLLISTHGLEVWPTIYETRAQFYKLIGESEISKELYREAAEMEPKYKDWAKEIDKF